MRDVLLQELFFELQLGYRSLRCQDFSPVGCDLALNVL